MTAVATRNSILLAENDANILYTLTGILEEEGFEVCGVSNFTEARRALKAREFDAVLSELSLERDGQGLELAREAKTLPSAPVVVLDTSNPTVEKLRQVMDLGVDYVAFKPLDLEEITSALKRLIAHRSDSVSYA